MSIRASKFGLLLSVPGMVGVAAAFMFAVPGTAMAASTVHAANTSTSCYQSPSAQNCDGQDPGNCWLDASPVNAQPVLWYNPDNGQPTGGSSGSIENWYSPHCGTNWAQYVDTSGSQGNVNINVCLGVNNFSHCAGWYLSDVFPAWSNMVYAPTTTATAYAEFSPGPARGQASA
jgi:hypothetical protein